MGIERREGWDRRELRGRRVGSVEGGRIGEEWGVKVGEGEN